jgi:hypothetical protein
VKNVSQKKKEPAKEPEEEITVKTFSESEIKDVFPKLFKELTNEVTANLSTEKAKEILFEDHDDDLVEEDMDITTEIDLESDNDEQIIPIVMEKDYLRGFTPQVIDFLRRAKTKDEALEVIAFLEKRNEITLEESINLKDQLEKQGLASFGDHKPDGYYFEYQRQKHMEEKMRQMKKQPGK